MNGKKKVRLMAETILRDSENSTFMRHAGYGELETEGEHFTLSYTQNQDGEQIQIHLSGTKKGIQMERKGEASGVLVFEPGKTIKSLYHLSFGEIEMQIQTERITCQLDDKDGFIELVYESGMVGEEMNKATYRCKWKR